MDIFQFLSSVNKISLFAFAVTIGFLVYELNQLTKERRLRQQPTIPQFNEAANAQTLAGKSVVIQPKAKSRGFSHQMLVIILIFTLIGLGLYTVFSAFSSTKKAIAQNSTPKVVIKEIQSKGVKLYSQQWQELKNIDILELKGGDTVLCTVETIPGQDIDRARIRVNKSTWDTSDITTNFDKEHNAYYIQYTIATEESELKIEAQLHSAKDGWLGE